MNEGGGDSDVDEVKNLVSSLFNLYALSLRWDCRAMFGKYFLSFQKVVFYKKTVTKCVFSSFCSQKVVFNFLITHKTVVKYYLGFFPNRHKMELLVSPQQVVLLNR